MKFITRGGATVALILSLIINSITVFAGGGGTGGSGEAGGGGPVGWSGTHGRVFVWYDRGALNNDDYIPDQGYYDTKDNKWHTNKDGVSTHDFFITKLTEKINSAVGGSYTYYVPTGYAIGARDDHLKELMTDAAKSAIARAHDPNTTRARIIGVAVTYSAGTVSGSGLDKDNVWAITTMYNGSHSFDNMFGNRMPSLDTELYSGKSGAINGNAWYGIIDKTYYNTANDNERWYAYAYRRAQLDNVNNAGDSGEYQIYVVAVANDEPTIKNYVVLKKISSNTSITG